VELFSPLLPFEVCIPSLQSFLQANASGIQNKIKMGGHSAVISPDGRCLVEADRFKTILITEIDLDKVYAFRQEIPCLKSRRPEVYNV